MSTEFDALSAKCVDTIRCLSADQPSAASSGHPGAPIGCAPMAYVLWAHAMRYDSSDPHWWNRDRFVLSNGHACALQYTMLHLTGYDLSLDDLRNFRKLGSRTPGHPEVHHTPGVEVTTGPLGQGFANAVGLACAQEHLAATFNRDGFELFNNYTFVIMGDGCNQEGVALEAASLAGHLKLGRLIVLYDDNKITIDGATDLSFTEDVAARYASYGWHTITVANGNTDLAAIAAAIDEAKAVTDRPSFISVKTIIGYGSLNENTAGVHGAPLKADDIAQLKTKFGMDASASFAIPDEVAAAFKTVAAKGRAAHDEWKTKFAGYKAAHASDAAELERRFRGELPSDWRAALPTFSPSDAPMATRKLSEGVLNAIAPRMPELVGGSADLTPSTLTWLKCSHSFQPNTRDGRYFHFGVREHAMAAVCNGLTAYGAFVPYCATFLNFIGYALGAMRLSALSRFRVLYVMTHDSIGLGEDGPTHQPIESLALVRAMPNMLLLRPCDGNEVSGAYAVALESPSVPSVLCFSRQNLPHLAGTSIDGVFKGAYTLVATTDEPQLVLVASGSEVSLCVEAAKNMADVRVRVVSMPCMELFDQQPSDYQTSVFADGVPTLAVEAAVAMGWEKYSHAQIAMHSFGASGKGSAVMDHFGFSTSNVESKARALLEFYAGKSAPQLFNRPAL